MKLLITGGSGLVGSAFKNETLKFNSTDLNLFDYNQSFQKIKSHNVDGIIHCAAKVGGLYSNLNYPADYFDENILMNSNIIKISKKLSISKFVGFLSTCIFPDNLGHSFTEEDLHGGLPHDSNFAYAYAKRMLDIQVKSYNQQFDLNYFNVIPTNIYGPRDNFNIENGHVIPGLIHKVWNAKRNKKPLIVYGSGIAVREFIFSEDLAEICIELIKNYNDKSPLIISNSKEEVTIKEIVEMIVEISNFRGEVVFDKSKSDGQLIKKTNTSKLKSHIGDYKFTPIEDGLKKTINWFFNNYKEARK